MSSNLAALAQDLDDLGLAVLLSLIADRHCIIRTEPAQLSTTAQKLQQVCSTKLDMSCKIIDCSTGLSLDNFREGVLVGANHNDETIEVFDDAHRQIGEHDGTGLALDERLVANVVIAQGLDVAEPDIQSQTVELLRSGRIFTRLAMHRTSKVFLFIALNSVSGQRLNRHLNDMFSICHVHDAESCRSGTRRKGSFDSIRSYSSTSRPFSLAPSSSSSSRTSSRTDFTALSSSTDHIRMAAEIETYMRNLVVAARMHKYVAGGISAAATGQLERTCRAFSVLHNIEYVPPALVDMAFRKTYVHRLVLADRHTAKSLRWGSDPDAVEKDMEGVTVEVALDAIIASVPTPL